MDTNPNIGYEGMLPSDSNEKPKKREGVEIMKEQKIEKPQEATLAYKGELEKLQEEYLTRKKVEDARNLKIKAIQEERMDMARRQAEKDRLAKEVKQLRFQQSPTGRTVSAVKNVAKRSWIITKNVGHGLSVAGGAVMGKLDNHSQVVAKVASNPLRHVQQVNMASQAKVMPIKAPVASGAVPRKSFNLDAFVDSMMGGSPAPAPMAQKAMYRKVKQKIRVKRGKKWITKTVTKRRLVSPRMPMQPKQAGFDFNAEMRKLEGIAGETPFAPVKSKKGKTQGFDVNEMLRGMPQ